LGTDQRLCAGEAQPQAGGLRRGGERGGAARRRAVPRFRVWRTGAGGPRPGGARKARRTRHRQSGQLRDPQFGDQPARAGDGGDALRTAAAAGLPGARRAPHGQPGPQRLRLGAGQAWPCRCADHRHDAHLLADPEGSAAGARSRAGQGALRHSPDGGQELHRVPGRYDRQRAAERRRPGPYRRRNGGRRPPHGPRTARGVPVVLHVRQPDGASGGADPWRGFDPGRGEPRLRIRRRSGARRRAQP
ncbi:hypothetical protein OY671_008830, partial [Metschnikowia pulcherrima]